MKLRFVPRIAVALLVLAPTVGAAQARVHGTIRDSLQGTPLPLVEVLVEGMNLSTLTDASGRYAMSVPLGFHTIRFRRVGYHSATRQLRLATADSVRLDLTMLDQAQRLDSVAVVAPGPPGIWPPGFEERRREGLGRFIADSILRRNEHTRLSSVLEQRAAFVRITRVASKTIALGRGRSCPMAIWLDGVLVYAPIRMVDERTRRVIIPIHDIPDIDRFSLVSLHAVELYTGASVPNQFRVAGAGCGVIVMWTRQQLGGS